MSIYHTHNFMAMVDGSKKCFTSKPFKQYKLKVTHINKKIDKWFRKHSSSNIGSFDKDEEYKMDCFSPSKFSESCSSDEEFCV